VTRSTGSHDTELRLEAVADAGKIASLRHAARAYAEEHCPELAQDVALTVSELCTNVVLHAYRHGTPGPMMLRLRFERGTLRGEVSDAGSGISPRLFDGARGAGIGLWTVAQLTDEMHLSRRPSGGTIATFSWECK
jgi:serine/threonine-protein kinase RsbW